MAKRKAHGSPSVGFFVRLAFHDPFAASAGTAPLFAILLVGRAQRGYAGISHFGHPRTQENGGSKMHARRALFSVLSVLAWLGTSSVSRAQSPSALYTWN